MIANSGIKGRLTAGFIIMVALLVVTAGVGWWGVSSLSVGIKDLIEEDATIAEAASRAQSSAEAMRRYEKDVLLNISNQEKIKEYSLKWEREYKTFSSSLDLLEHSFSRSNNNYQINVYELRKGLKFYSDGFQGVLAKAVRGEFGSSQEGNLAMEGFKEGGGRFLVTESKELARIFNREVLKAKQYYPQLVWKTRSTLLLVISLALVLALILPPVIIGNITDPIKYLTHVAQKLSEGELGQDIRIFGADEQVQLAMAFRNMIVTTRQIASHARTVAAGDFSHSIDPRGPHDELATSLNQMTESLAETKAQNEKRSWIEAGRSLLSTNIEGKENLAELASGITGALAGHLGAQAALLYLPCDRSSFFVEGAFGVSETISMTISCEVGEGLVGQAIRDRKPMVVESTEDSELKITSGMGVITPRCIVAFPLVYNDQITGALEFAMSRDCQPRDLKLLELVSNSISVTLARAASHEKSIELLKVTRSQAQALEGHRKEIAQKADELALASDNKSRFLANMSHDLRSPMNSIMILSTLMKESDLSREQIIDHSETIENCGTELLQLIDDILDLSKVEAGQLEFHEETVILTSLCKTINSTMGPLAKQKGLEFKIINEVPERETVATDPKRILQIVRNLVSNAIKFTSEGTVTVSFGAAEDRPTILEISVSDTGIGIAQDRQDIIFEEFRQAEKNIDRVYGGTGLGLSISLKMAHGLNGTLGLESTPGQGSTFTLNIPWIQSASSEADVEALIIETVVTEVAEETLETEEALPLKAEFNGCRALVMGPDMRRLFNVVSHMEDCGYAVEAVSNLDQALDTLGTDDSLNMLVLDHPSGTVDSASLELLVGGIGGKNIPVVVRGPQNAAEGLTQHSHLAAVEFLHENRPVRDLLEFRLNPFTIS